MLMSAVVAFLLILMVPACIHPMLGSGGRTAGNVEYDETGTTPEMAGDKDAVI